MVTQNYKFQISGGSLDQKYQQSQTSINSLQQLQQNRLNVNVDDGLNSLTGSRAIIVAGETTTENIPPSPANTPTNLLNSNNSQKLFKSNSYNNFNSSSNKGSAQPSVFVIKTNSRATPLAQEAPLNQSFAGSILSSNNNNNSNSNNLQPNNDQENIIVEQTSKLGVLVQTKVLEEKVKFIFFIYSSGALVFFNIKSIKFI